MQKYVLDLTREIIPELWLISGDVLSIFEKLWLNISSEESLRILQHATEWPVPSETWVTLPGHSESSTQIYRKETISWFSSKKTREKIKHETTISAASRQYVVIIIDLYCNIPQLLLHILHLFCLVLWAWLWQEGVYLFLVWFSKHQNPRPHH